MRSKSPEGGRAWRPTARPLTPVELALRRYQAEGEVDSNMREVVEHMFAGRDVNVSITASNGSVAALSVGEVRIGAHHSEKPTYELSVPKRRLGPLCGCGRELWTDDPDRWNGKRRDWYHADDHTPACASAFAPAPVAVIGRPPPPPMEWEASQQPSRPVQQRIVRAMELPAGAIAPRVGAAGLTIVHAALVILAAYGLFSDNWTWLTLVSLLLNGLAVWFRVWQLRRATARREPNEQVRVPAEEAAAEVIPRPKRAKSVPVRDFTAVSECPNCGLTTLHELRAPSPTTVITTEGGRTVMKEDPADADVIRLCGKCGQEWGEK